MEPFQLHHKFGCGVYRKYGFTTFTPFGNFFCASSVEIAGTTITSSPCFQSAGVATLWLAVSCNESTTRNTSWKLRPVDAGYVMISFTILSGPITTRLRTV